MNNTPATFPILGDNNPHDRRQLEVSRVPTRHGDGYALVAIDDSAEWGNSITTALVLTLIAGGSSGIATMLLGQPAGVVLILLAVAALAALLWGGPTAKIAALPITKMLAHDPGAADRVLRQAVKHPRDGALVRPGGHP